MLFSTIAFTTHADLHVGATALGAGADAVKNLDQKIQLLFAQANAYHELSSSLTHEDA
jgi:hypothetical protein